jgi:glycosyltransferase involved in cell wall biosynthesis
MPPNHTRLVAALNVWNDLTELRETLPRWYEAVDHVIAVDGAYLGTPVDVPYSTDGTLEFLRTLTKVELIETTTFWPDQAVKRSEYFRRGQDGDVLWVVDADEYVEDAVYLRSFPGCAEVGWITCTSPLYRRAQQQPRLFRWSDALGYSERHHWVQSNGRLLASHQRGGPGVSHCLLPVRFYNSRGIRRPYERMAQAGHARVVQYERERNRTTFATDNGGGHEPLRIVHLGPFDPAFVMGRLHTGINTTSPHSSAMVCPTHPFALPRQYDPDTDHALVQDLIHTADVVHHHVNYYGWGAFPRLVGKRHGVMHHHGTELRMRPKEYAEWDAERVQLRLVSNLELLQYGEGLQWLPNPVSVGRYRRWFTPPVWGQPFRVAHSPSKPKLKGTEQFLRACDRVRQRGVRMEAVVITNSSLAESLRAKSQCHAAFDSFWLGLQCSGLEAAAMGLPVVAGDPDVRGELLGRFGAVPYTYANDEDGLVEALERLATDEAFYRAEQTRLGEYVAGVHDLAVVTARYLDLLDEALGWRTRLRLGTTTLPLAR